MATPTANARPTPERILTVLSAFQQTAILRAAIELDVFTAIGEGANTPASLAQKSGAAERGVRILCDNLTIQGFLSKDTGRYALTPESAMFLDRRSPACMASLADFIGGEWFRKSFDALTESVRKGGTADLQGDNSKPKDEVWVNFARSMAPLAVPNAEFIAGLIDAKAARPCKVLDIAAGHGMYGITIAKHNPNAQITAADWPAVLEVAKENAHKAGVAARFAVRAGSAFEIDLGEGYDLVLLTNIFHHFDAPTCEKLMRRVHAALKPGGRAITLEFVPNEDRVSPPVTASFSIVMLASTDAGDAFTLTEYDGMFRRAGFARTTLHAMPGLPEQVLVSEK
jgi:SAM-dependent methyltransferase